MFYFCLEAWTVFIQPMRLFHLVPGSQGVLRTIGVDLFPVFIRYIRLHVRYSRKPGSLTARRKTYEVWWQFGSDVSLEVYVWLFSGNMFNLRNAQGWRTAWHYLQPPVGWFDVTENKSGKKNNYVFSPLSLHSHSFVCGRWGIQTPDTKKRYTGFRVQRIRSLCQSSFFGGQR